MLILCRRVGFIFAVLVLALVGLGCTIWYSMFRRKKRSAIPSCVMFCCARVRRQVLEVCYNSVELHTINNYVKA